MPIRDRLLILAAILFGPPAVLALGIVLAVAGAVSIVARLGRRRTRLPLATVKDNPAPPRVVPPS